MRQQPHCDDYVEGARRERQLEQVAGGRRAIGEVAPHALEAARVAAEHEHVARERAQQRRQLTVTAAHVEHGAAAPPGQGRADRRILFLEQVAAGGAGKAARIGLRSRFDVGGFAG